MHSEMAFGDIFDGVVFQYEIVGRVGEDVTHKDVADIMLFYKESRDTDHPGECQCYLTDISVDFPTAHGCDSGHCNMHGRESTVGRIQVVG